MADRALEPSARLIVADPVVSQPILEVPIDESSSEPEPEPEPEPVAVAAPIPTPTLLNDRERQRMDVAMAGLSRFGPVADQQRPAPRTEVDPLSSVSSADWSGMDGMGEAADSFATPNPTPTPTPAPVLAQTPSRRESVSAPVAELETISTPAVDPIKGWVTADRLFSDFGD